MVELSTDNSYWSVNSGGVFRKGYGNNKEGVWSASEEQNKQSATDNTLRAADKSDNPTVPNGNVSNSSDGKGKVNSSTSQAKGVNVAENQGANGVEGAVEAAESETDTEPTEWHNDAVSGGSENTVGSGRSTKETPTERELADNLRSRERQHQEKILPNLGNKYSLPAEQANNGELFYQDAEGNTNLAVIPDEIFERLGLSPVPFKLTETMGWHVYDHHAKEAKLSNIGDAIDFVSSIIKNVDHVRLGRNNSYIFSVEDGRNKIGKRAVTIVVNSETGEFMGISTSGYETLGKLKERPLLWERGADFAPEDVATPTISTIKSQQGDETLSRTKGQSNASSAGKSTVNSSTSQAKVVNVAKTKVRAVWREH